MAKQFYYLLKQGGFSSVLLVSLSKSLLNYLIPPFPSPLPFLSELAFCERLRAAGKLTKVVSIAVVD